MPSCIRRRRFVSPWTTPVAFTIATYVLTTSWPPTIAFPRSWSRPCTRSHPPAIKSKTIARVKSRNYYYHIQYFLYELNKKKYRLRDRLSLSLSSFSSSDFLGSRFNGNPGAVEPLTWTAGKFGITGANVTSVTASGTGIGTIVATPFGSVSVSKRRSCFAFIGNTYSCVSRVLKRSSTKLFVSAKSNTLLLNFVFKVNAYYRQKIFVLQEFPNCLETQDRREAAKLAYLLERASLR